MTGKISFAPVLSLTLVSVLVVLLVANQLEVKDFFLRLLVALFSAVPAGD